MHFSTVQFGKILVIFCFIWDRWTRKQKDKQTETGITVKQFVFSVLFFHPLKADIHVQRKVIDQSATQFRRRLITVTMETQVNNNSLI